MRDKFTCSNTKNASNVLNEEERNLWLVRGRRGGYICYLNFNPTTNNMNTKESLLLVARYKQNHPPQHRSFLIIQGNIK